jgi:ribA/ribD-fused uncharacterized protein
MERILFYDEAQPYGWCSNFASVALIIDGQLWPTTEHYYQAMKYAGTPYAEVVRLAHSPMVAKNLTRDPQHPPRADWDAVKDSVMLTAVRAKFRQYAHLADLLLATGDAELVEHATTVGALDFVDLRRFAQAVRAPALVVSAHDDRVVHTDVSFTLAAALTDAAIVSHHHRRVGGHFLQRKVGDVVAEWLMTLAR